MTDLRKTIEAIQQSIGPSTHKFGLGREITFLTVNNASPLDIRALTEFALEAIEVLEKSCDCNYQQHLNGLVVKAECHQCGFLAKHFDGGSG